MGRWAEIFAKILEFTCKIGQKMRLRVSCALMGEPYGSESAALGGGVWLLGHCAALGACGPWGVAALGAAYGSWGVVPCWEARCVVRSARGAKRIVPP